MCSVYCQMQENKNNNVDRSMVCQGTQSKGIWGKGFSKNYAIFRGICANYFFIFTQVQNKNNLKLNSCLLRASVSIIQKFYFLLLLNFFLGKHLYYMFYFDSSIKKKYGYIHILSPTQ